MINITIYDLVKVIQFKYGHNLVKPLYHILEAWDVDGDTSLLYRTLWNSIYELSLLTTPACKFTNHIKPICKRFPITFDKNTQRYIAKHKPLSDYPTIEEFLYQDVKKHPKFNRVHIGQYIFFENKKQSNHFCNMINTNLSKKYLFDNPSIIGVFINQTYDVKHTNCTILSEKTLTGEHSIDDLINSWIDHIGIDNLTYIDIHRTAVKRRTTEKAYQIYNTYLYTLLHRNPKNYKTLDYIKRRLTSFYPLKKINDEIIYSPIPITESSKMTLNLIMKIHDKVPHNSDIGKYIGYIDIYDIFKRFNKIKRNKLSYVSLWNDIVNHTFM